MRQGFVTPGGSSDHRAYPKFWAFNSFPIHPPARRGFKSQYGLLKKNLTCKKCLYCLENRQMKFLKKR
jgi:hypothetical protein